MLKTSSAKIHAQRAFTCKTDRTRLYPSYFIFVVNETSCSYTFFYLAATFHFFLSSLWNYFEDV